MEKGLVPSTRRVVAKPTRELALGSTTTRLFGNDCFRRCHHIRTRFAIVESSAIVQRDLLQRRCRTGTRTNGLIFCCAQSYLRLCINSTNVLTKTRASRESASRECRPQTWLGVTTATTESTVAARVANETKSRNARHDESAAFSDMHRRRASGDFVAASSSLPPVSKATVEAANEFVGFFSLLAETHSHCVQATTDVDRLVIRVDRGRDGTAVASQATLFTDDDEKQSFLDAEWQHSEDEERDQQTLIELYRDLLEASTSRRRRTHRAGVFDASWLPDDEERPSAFVAGAVQPHNEDDDDDDDADSTRCRVPTRNCSSCKHDLPAATHFYSDRKTCKACLRYHLRYSRRKRKHEKKLHN